MCVKLESTKLVIFAKESYNKDSYYVWHETTLKRYGDGWIFSMISKQTFILWVLWVVRAEQSTMWSTLYNKNETTPVVSILGFKTCYSKLLHNIWAGATRALVGCFTRQIGTTFSRIKFLSYIRVVIESRACCRPSTEYQLLHHTS